MKIIFTNGDGIEVSMTPEQIAAGVKNSPFADLVVDLILKGAGSQNGHVAPAKLSLEDAEKLDSGGKATWLQTNWGVSQELAEQLVTSGRPLAEIAAMDANALNSVIGIRPFREAIMAFQRIQARTGAKATRA
jgi:hypothetical protein